MHVISYLIQDILLDLWFFAEDGDFGEAETEGDVFGGGGVVHSVFGVKWAQAVWEVEDWVRGFEDWVSEDEWGRSCEDFELSFCWVGG